MHWLGWCLIVVLFLLVMVGWMGRPIDFPHRKGKRLANETEELERR